MQWAQELLDLIVPRCCAGCSVPGTVLCFCCERELAAGLLEQSGPVNTGVMRCGLPPTWAQGAYCGVLANIVRLHKDENRLDLTPWCARYLRSSIAGCLTQDPVVTAAARRGDLLITAVPSSARARRDRGRDPLWDIIVAASAGGFGQLPLPARLLRPARSTRDQVGLGAIDRARNLAGAMVVPAGWRHRASGHVILVIDDIVTTGSTLLEAARALREAGASHVAAVAIAATPRADYGRGMKGVQDPHGRVLQADALSARGLPFSAQHILLGGGDLSA